MNGVDVNGWIMKILVGGAVSATIAVTSFNGSKIDRNKDSNEAAHYAIITSSQQKFDVLQDGIHEIATVQAVQNEVLKRIENKL